MRWRETGGVASAASGSTGDARALASDDGGIGSTVTHLVRALPVAGGPPLTLDECHRLVRAAHDYLAQCGAEAIERARQAKGDRYWGSRVKRIRVALPDRGRPELVAATVREHNLVEVLNQCATMERLLDALKWAQTEPSGLRDYAVERCHPTTSSDQHAGKKAIADNDLVLIGTDGTKARFEVSDVVGRTDGNRKEARDLTSLGVPRFAGSDTRQAGIWPVDRLFLVVSEAFANGLRPKSRPGPRRTYVYAEVKDDGPTRILEVMSVAAW